MDKLCNIPYNEFIIRLPNIIMLIFYFIGSYMISKDEKHKYLLFSGLVLNYYVMEFFGLARGYGIAASFVIWMCYFFKKASTNNYDDKNIFISVIFGLLACYSNTISILALFVICLIYLIQLIRKKNFSINIYINITIYDIRKTLSDRKVLNTIMATCCTRDSRYIFIMDK